MTTAYQDSTLAIKYLEFLDSVDGKIQQQVLFDEIFKHLPKDKHLKLLDAGCGPGWLAGKLKTSFPEIEACDSSDFFIQLSKANHAGINFLEADLQKPLPYPKNYFDLAILNMAAPDMTNLKESLHNLAAVIKPHGKLIMTIPNPKYTFPAAVWKRGFLGWLLGQKPRLVTSNALIASGAITREFGHNGYIPSFYYTLSDYILAAQKNGLQLKQTVEIKSQTDSEAFNLTYRLYRYPLLLLLEMEKINQ